MALQAQHAALVNELEAVKKRLADAEDWAAERARYELSEISPRVFAFAVKESMRGTEPPHLLCANCFQQSKKSLLQSKGTVLEIETLNCPACRAEIYVKRPGQGFPSLGY